MKLWLISQTENTGYDTYDSAIVAAKNEQEARSFHPEGDAAWQNGWKSWCTSPDAVSVLEIGTAVKGASSGVILASFNAG